MSYEEPTEGDLQCLFDFNERLADELGYSVMDMERDFLERCLHNYRNPPTERSIQSMDRGEFFDLSEDEREQKVREYYLGLLQKRFDDAEELSDLHGVPLDPTWT